MILQIAAFALIVVLFLVRAPKALRKPAARPAWFASGFAILGLLTLGFIVPIPLLDGWIGGFNAWNLAEALAATASFWYFRRAAALLDNPEVVNRRSWPLLALLAAITLSFFTIDPRSTDIDFVDHNLEQPGLFVYLLIYLAGIAAIAGSAGWIVRRRWKGVFAPFVLGFALVAVAAVIDIGYITTGFFRLGTHDFQLSFFHAFNALFYPGIFLLAVGFTTVYTLRWVASVQPVWRIRRLALQAIRTRMIGRSFSMELRYALAGEDPVAETYDEVVKIRDLSFLDHIELTRREAKIVNRVEAAIVERGGLAVPEAAL
jgi:hypothetical protein